MSLDLNSIRAHHEDYTAAHNHVGAFDCCTAHYSADDIPELLAALERYERAEWACVGCGYHNRGPVCTHCARPLISAEETTR